MRRPEKCFEKERTFEVSKRLVRWSNNDFNKYGKQLNSSQQHGNRKESVERLADLASGVLQGLHVSSIKEAVLNTPNLPLSVIRKEITLAGARAILVIAINELVFFFNVGKR